MAQPAAARCLIGRADRYQRWHDHPRVGGRTAFFAAAAIVNRALVRHTLLSPFLLDLGATLEAANTLRALDILDGRLYRGGSVEGNTLDFIRFEQTIVQAHLDGLRRHAPRSYRREIRAVNASLRALRCGIFRALADRCLVHAADATRRCLGGPLDFAEQDCRVMLGAHIAHHATSRRSQLQPVAGPMRACAVGRILPFRAQGATSEQSG